MMHKRKNTSYLLATSQTRKLRSRRHDKARLNTSRPIPPQPLNRHADYAGSMNQVSAKSCQKRFSLPVTGDDHVYLLPTYDRTLVKIGRSIDPLDRIAGLASLYPEIDLAHSIVVAVDSPKIETALHAIFDLRREPRPIRCDGYTEWFNGDCLDEALAMLDAIATQRGSDYRVFYNVDALIADHQTRNPNPTQRAPRLSAAERSVRAAQAWDLMQYAAIEHAQALGDRIIESGFDSLVRCAGHAYLARTVTPTDAPECWHPETGYRGSIWGRKFSEASMADINVAGGHCLFHMIDPPVFGEMDASHGREYFRICKARPVMHGSGPLDAISGPAFAELWRVLDELPVVGLPGEWPDLTKTGDAGLQ